MQEIFAREARSLEDAKFFSDLLTALCKEYKLHFYGYNLEMHLKVARSSPLLAFQFHQVRQAGEWRRPLQQGRFVRCLLYSPRW